MRKIKDKMDNSIVVNDGGTDVIKGTMDLTKKNKETKGLGSIKVKDSVLIRTATDLRKFRNALRYAEDEYNPTYVELYRIYTDIKDDSEVFKSVGTLRDYVLCSDFAFSKSNSKIRALFEGKWFKDYLKYAFDSMYWGQSLIRIGTIIDDVVTDIELVPRQNVNPKTKNILPSLNNHQVGVNFMEDKEIEPWYCFLTNDSDDNYLGVYSKVGPYQIMLKNTQLALLNYNERFGSPQVIAQIGSKDEYEIARIEQYLSNFQSNSYAIMSLEDKFTPLETKNTTGDIFFSTIKEHKANINSIVMGNEIIGKEKSFVGSIDASTELLETKVETIQKYVEFCVNDVLIPKLYNLGLSFLKGVRFEYVDEENVNPDTQMKMLDILLKNGVKVNLKELAEEYGIEVVENTPGTDTESNCQAMMHASIQTED